MSKKPRYRRICRDCRKNQAVYAMQQIAYCERNGKTTACQLRTKPKMCPECFMESDYYPKRSVICYNPYECRKTAIANLTNGKMRTVVFYCNPKAWKEYVDNLEKETV